MNDNPKNHPKITPRAATPDLRLALDVGHSSIGWQVLHTAGALEIKGCGAVIFRADDCLASARRAYRRQRRHIRSTRQRIARMKVLLKHLGVLDQSQLDRPGCAWPWLLAARVLCGGPLLTWPELWDVLRWYAHNRGYDANRRGSAADAEANAEDTEKEENAKTLMEKHGVKTMAETFCAMCGIDPLGKKKSANLPGDKRPKGQNAAFPRATVEGEVRRLLQAHFGKLPKVDASLERALLGRDNRDQTAWQAIPCPELKLPKRYQGALLFGQLVPRFYNRIISICPISGQKVPSRNCREFLNFRWAMLLANIQVARFGEKELSPLTAPERRALDAAMRQEGSMGVGEFKRAVRQVASAIRDKLDSMFLDPNNKEALLLDPVQELVQSDHLKPFWPLLPERLQKRARGQWRRGKAITLGRLRAQLQELGLSVVAFDAELARQFDAANTRRRKKDESHSREDLLARPLTIKRLDGRAAYARHLLNKAFDEVLAGKHPKEEGGCLFVTEQMRQAQLTRQVAEQTNNHLVRHRLLILERLLAAIIKEYAGNDKSRIAAITIEVNRDLREMSGMTVKEKAQALALRLADHHRVVERLEEDESLMALLRRQGSRVTAGLIRKARVAADLDWTCPYTGQKYEPINLVTRQVDKDHVVPRADRASDSLDSLVITFSAINKWKGKRTAWQFIQQEQGKPVPDLPNLSIMSLSRFERFVDELPPHRDPRVVKRMTAHRRPIDDDLRRWRRKQLLKIVTCEEKEFTPRDLTQTSQLVRLGQMVLKKAFRGCPRQPDIISLPSQVTVEVRKAWDLIGCLSLAAPDILDENRKPKKKEQIRDITHLHHALDACVLGLASHFIPNNGHVWKLLTKRYWLPEEQRELSALGIFGKDSEGRLRLLDWDKTDTPLKKQLGRLKEQIRQRLAERRVVQHIPARMDGLRVEQNTWRVISVKNGEATLRQRIRAADGSRPTKTTEEKTSKLLGLQPARGEGKLQANKGALVIPDNFGVALVKPEAIIIPFHKVWPRLSELKAANGGRMPPILRNGQLIRVPDGKRFKGVWRVFSAKNNASGMALDIGSPDVVRLKNKTEGHKINVRLATLLKDGLEILRVPLTGVAAPPAAS